MNELKLNDEFYFEQIERIAKEYNGYYHEWGPCRHNSSAIIGEHVIMLYSNDQPEWVFTFLLIGVTAVPKYNTYRLIYKYLN
jgi:hypothetical protein